MPSAARLLYEGKANQNLNFDQLLQVSDYIDDTERWPGVSGAKGVLIIIQVFSTLFKKYILPKKLLCLKERNKIQRLKTYLQRLILYQ